MDIKDPGFIYLVLVLPTLFALTLIAEGLHKILRKEPGWVNLSLGLIFLLVVIFGYLNF